MKFETDLLLLQKRCGLCAMALLIFALAAFIDAMVGGLGGNTGLIELVPGERFLISGPMPPKTESLADFVIEGEPEDGSVRLVPEAVFSGYWLGGAMWRGALVTTSFSRADNWVIRVKDRFGEKQNPALVFTVRVYPDPASKQSHSPSWLMRRTGINPYYFALAFLLGGVIAGGATFYFAKGWSNYLGAQSCGEIFVLKKGDHGLEATCDLVSSCVLTPGIRCTLHRRNGEIVGTGQVVEQKPHSVLVTLDNQSNAKLGDIACFTAPHVDSKAHLEDRPPLTASRE